MFACANCGRGFTNPGGLAAHMMACDAEGAAVLHAASVREARQLQDAAELEARIEASRDDTDDEEEAELLDFDELNHQQALQWLAQVASAASIEAHKEVALMCTEWR